MSALAKNKELEPGREPWTKQPWESWKAYEAFTMYRDLGSTRTLREVAERIIQGSPKRKQESVERQLGGWSAAHKWVERVDAYVAHMDRALVIARETQVARINEEDLEIGDAMLRIVHNSVDLMDAVGAGIPLELVERWVTTAVKTRRLAAGMATDHLKAGLQITSQDAARILNRAIDIACEFIQPEQREEYIRRVMEETG